LVLLYKFERAESTSLSERIKAFAARQRPSRRTVLTIRIAVQAQDILLNQPGCGMIVLLSLEISQA
jgi:hypothetical protein